MLVHVAEEIDDRRTPPIGVPGSRVELLLLTVEDQRLLAFGDVQQENRHVSRALLVAANEHSTAIVGHRTDLVLDIVAMGHCARPATATRRQRIDLPLLRPQVVELEHDPAGRPAVVADRLLIPGRQLAREATLHGRAPEVELARAVVNVADLAAVGREGKVVEEVGPAEREELVEGRARGTLHPEAETTA